MQRRGGKGNGKCSLTSTTGHKIFNNLSTSQTIQSQQKQFQGNEWPPDVSLLAQTLAGQAIQLNNLKPGKSKIRSLKEKKLQETIEALKGKGCTVSVTDESTYAYFIQPPPLAIFVFDRTPQTPDLLPNNNGEQAITGEEIVYQPRRK